MCAFVYMTKAHAHGDCCEAMHACAFCVFFCTRRMLTVIAAMPCMYVPLVAHCDRCEAMHARVRDCVLDHI